MGQDRLALELVNDLVQMGYVLQWVHLQGRDPLKVVKGTRSEAGVSEHLAEFDSRGFLRKLWVMGSDERM